MVFLFIGEVQAQSSIEISGGVNIASRGPRGSGFHHLRIYGFNAGLSYEYRFGNYFALSTGLAVNTRGYAYTTTINYITPYVDTSYEFRIRRKFLYLDLPVSAKIYYEIGPDANVIMSAGPFVGLSVTGRFDYFYGFANINKFGIDTEIVRVKPENLPQPRLEVGFNFRFGIEIKRYSLNASYSQGLMNHANTYGKLVKKDAKIRNWTISVGIGYRFEFKSRSKY